RGGSHGRIPPAVPAPRPARPRALLRGPPEEPRAGAAARPLVARRGQPRVRAADRELSGGPLLKPDRPRMPPVPDPTRRFSDRVEHYTRYRPSYPDEVIGVLRRRTRFQPGSLVADIGAGTGISTELFHRHGSSVFAVEPNAEMRAEAERRLSNYSTFRSLAGTAEATSLPDRSVD